MVGAFAQKAQAHDSRIVAYVFKAKGKSKKAKVRGSQSFN